jgi:hypothetical protein
MNLWRYENSPALNERFGASGGVTPQKEQCKLASEYPATMAVSPRLRQAAGRYGQPSEPKVQPLTELELDTELLSPMSGSIENLYKFESRCI